MTVSPMDTTAIAIDFGSGRIKIAYFDAETKDVEPMRLGSHGEFFLPAYIGVTANGNIVVGEQAERMVNDEREARWVSDNVKRDLSRLESLSPRLPIGQRSKSVEHVLERVFSELRTRVLRHQAFLGKDPLTVYVTYTLLYPRTIKDLFECVVQKVFGASEVVPVDEATAAAEMLRNVPAAASADLKSDLILLDCGAGTIDCCFLRWSGNRYRILPLERMKTAYISIPIGGINIDEALVKLIRQKAGKAFNVRKSSVSVRQQVRLAKHEYCLYGDGAWSIRVNPETDVALQPDEIQTAIRSEFIDKLCQNPEPDPARKKRSEHEVLTEYIEGIKSSLPIDRKPTLVLVGGCAKIEGFDDALHKAFDLPVSKVNDLQRGEYATVLGPIYAHMKKQKVSHAREKAARETRQTASGAKTDPFAGPIQALNVSPNRRYLIAATGQSIQHWVIDENTTPVSLEQKRTLEHTDTISAVAFSWDSRLFAAATHTGDIRLWEADSNLPITDFKAKDSTITCLAFSPNGTEFATGDREHTVKLWNIPSGKAAETFVGKNEKYRHKGAVNSLAFSPRGEMLASGGQDGVVKIWSTNTEQKPSTTHATTPRKIIGAISTSGASLIGHKEHKCPVTHVSFYSYLNTDKYTCWISLGLDGKLMFWTSNNNTILGRTVAVIMGKDISYLRSREEPDVFFELLSVFLTSSDKGSHENLNLRGMRPDWIKNGKLLIREAIGDIADAALEFPYTETLWCVAFDSQIGKKPLVAFGSQEGSIQLWDGRAALITLS